MLNFVYYPEHFPPELEHLRGEVDALAKGYNYNQHLKSHVSHTKLVSDALMDVAGLAGTPGDATTVAMTARAQFIVGTNNGVWFNSTGAWAKSSGIQGYVDSIAPSPSDSSLVFASTGYFSNGDIYISHDGGHTFSLLNTNLNPWFQNGYDFQPLQLFALNTTRSASGPSAAAAASNQVPPSMPATLAPARPMNSLRLLR